MAWNRASGAPKVAPKKSPSKMRISAGRNGRLRSKSLEQCIVAGLVVVAVASVCAVLFMGKGEKPVEKAEKKQARIKEVAPSRVKDQKQSEAMVAQAPAVEKWHGVEIKSRNVITNGNTIFEKIITVDGKKHSYNHSIPTKQIFEHISDNVIASALMMRQDRIPPPDPHMVVTDAEFLKSIETPIIIEKDDDEETANLKRMVREARLQVKDMMDEGKSFDEIITAHCEDIRSKAELRIEALKGLREVEASGNMDDAKVYSQAVNKKLEEMGIDKIRDANDGSQRRRKPNE